jgi:hypothetical protein
MKKVEKPERVRELATGLRGVIEERRHIQGKRDDGLTVFLDKFVEGEPDAEVLAWLNEVRLHAKPVDVILSVGLVRYMQIVQNYAKKYHPESLPALRQIATSLVKPGGAKKDF